MSHEEEVDPTMTTLVICTIRFDAIRVFLWPLLQNFESDTSDRIEAALLVVTVALVEDPSRDRSVKSEDI